MLAIVLSRRDIKEYDQVITLLTQPEGKRNVLARGVKKIVSKNTAHLEPFSVVDVSMVKGKELDILTKVQPISYYKTIRQDEKKQLIAAYAMRFVESITVEKQTDQALFQIVHQWCTQIAHLHNARLLMLDSLIIQLLTHIGFAPVMDQCVICEKKEQVTQFSIESGGVVCKSCASSRHTLPLHKPAQQVFQSCLTERPLVLEKNNCSPQVYNQLHHIIHRFASYHLGKEVVDWKDLRTLIN